MVTVVSDTEPTVRFGAWKDEISALVSGAIVGVTMWLLAYILNQYVIGMIACRTGSSIISCSDAPTVSAVVALIFASVAGLTLLVRRRIFRPLLVVLSAILTLWGISGSWLAAHTLVDFLLTVVVTSLVYVVFAWFAKVRQFWISLAISIVLVVIFRVMITL
jgi:hypothetical protein